MNIPLFIFISVLFLHSLNQNNSQSLLSYIVAYYLRHFDEVGSRKCLFHWLSQPHSPGSLRLSTDILFTSAVNVALLLVSSLLFVFL